VRTYDVILAMIIRYKLTFQDHERSTFEGEDLFRSFDVESVESGNQYLYLNEIFFSLYTI